MRLLDIHASFINGNLTQAVNKINQYFILYDFFEKYLIALKDIYVESDEAVLQHFSFAVI
jgi:hypothetical protein